MAKGETTPPEAASGGNDAATSTRQRTAADRRYGELFAELKGQLGEHGWSRLFEFDEVVGQRLSEAAQARRAWLNEDDGRAVLLAAARQLRAEFPGEKTEAVIAEVLEEWARVIPAGGTAR
jgi:hypothetical protein